MEEIEEDDFFPLHTDNRREAMKHVLQKLQKKPRDKGNLVRSLVEEDVYSQKKDCKDFIKNLVLSSNHQVVEVGRRKISLPNEKEVTHP